MNTQNLYKFKKKIGQNYLIFNLKFNFDLCSGYNFFNNFNNEIDFNKNKFINNNIYFLNNINNYSNFLNFNFSLKKILNINISFNIIKIFLNKINTIKRKIFKIIININNLFLFKHKIFKKKFFFKKNFFPYPKINIIKIFFIKIKKTKMFFLLNNNKIKSEKTKFFLNIIIKIFYKNVFINKI
ncbi:MAG: hypothetical protein ACSLEH_00300 [Candidatus Carsonella ruddii]